MRPWPQDPRARDGRELGHAAAVDTPVASANCAISAIGHQAPRVTRRKWPGRLMVEGHNLLSPCLDAAIQTSRRGHPGIDPPLGHRRRPAVRRGLAVDAQVAPLAARLDDDLVAPVRGRYRT